jgi:iron complex transport system permease protein
MRLARNAANPFWVSLGLLVLALLLSVAVGSVWVPVPVMWDVTLSRLMGQDLSEALKPFGVILFTLRLPRTALVAVTGAALAGSGAAFQGLFRNPLADPYLIGVAAGAGLGAVVVISAGVAGTALGIFSVPAAAFIGAILTVFIVYELARVGKSLPTTNLILAGVAVSSFATSLTSFLMIRSTGDLRRALVWLLGGGSMSGWQPVLAQLPYVVIGLGVILAMGHALNVMQVGEEQAQQLGLPVDRVRLLVIIAASLATAAAVAFAGIIGFVGLIVPHIVRMVWGPDYRRILPLSIFGGAIFLLAADVLARVVLAPQEVPLGIITSLFGAPFFLWLLRRVKNQNFW